MKIWHSKEQNRLFSWIVKTIGWQMALVFNSQKMVFIIHFKRLSITARTVSLMGSMSMNSLPLERTLCSYLSKNITSKNIKWRRTAHMRNMVLIIRWKKGQCVNKWLYGKSSLYRTEAAKQNFVIQSSVYQQYTCRFYVKTTAYQDHTVCCMIELMLLLTARAMCWKTFPLASFILEVRLKEVNRYVLQIASC